MSIGPIQTTLLILGFSLSATLSAVLLNRPALAYVRWLIIAALSAGVAQDVVSTFFLNTPEALAWTGAYLATELIQALFWFVFSRRYARSSNDPSHKPPGWLPVFLVAAVLGGMAAPTGYLNVPATNQAEMLVTLSMLGFLVRVVSLLLFILALTSLETTLVNSVHGQRWRIKFTILGGFTVITAQVFTISLGLLYKGIDLTMTPARQIGFILGAAFLLYSTLFRGGESPVMVSKRLAKSSVVLFAAGAYLLFLGAFGLIVGMTGHSGNAALLLAVSLVAGVGLLALLLSDRFRRKCNRLLQHYFYKEKYDYRLQWLSFTKRLTQASSRDGLYQAVLLGFCETFGMGGAVLYLKDGDKPRMSPVESWEVHLAPPVLADASSIAELARAGRPTIDVREDAVAVDGESLEFFGQTGAAFIVPLSREESLDGFILLTNPIDSSEEYNQEDFDLMEALATQSHSVILNHILSDQLAKSRDMEVMGKVSTFIVHDLKNLVYTLSLIVENAKKYIQNQEFQRDMLKGLENTVSKMHLLISQLRQLPSRETLKLEQVDLMQLATDTIANTQVERLELKGEPIITRIDKEQIRKVILNLVLNARDASPEGRPIVLETGHDNGVVFKVTDSGCGMSRDFIKDHLFKPFRTTKPKGMGIGLYQCKQIVEAHGGAIEVESAEGRGSVFLVRLPEAAVEPTLGGA